MSDDKPNVDKRVALIWAPLTGSAAQYMVRLGYVTPNGGGAGWPVWSKN